METALAITRFFLGLTLLFTAFTTCRTMQLLNSVFRPHGAFVSFWCTVCAVCMIVLSMGVTDVSVFEVLNLSALLLFWGWSLLLVRIGRRVRSAAKVGADAE